jgi:hypothetical protein
LKSFQIYTFYNYKILKIVFKDQIVKLIIEMMFHSSQNAGKINELRAFLQNVARNIISSPDI